MQLALIRKFETRNFRVIVCAENDDGLDLSFDTDGSVLQDLDCGQLVAFCVHAYVVYKPTNTVLSNDYLGNCIYTSYAAFMDHKHGMGKHCGSYFADMVRNVCQDARKALTDLQSVRVRRV